MGNPFDCPGDIDTDERKIWWLASYPKSGNTWVRMFLNCYATRAPISVNAALQYVLSDLKPETYQMMSPRPLSEMSIREQFMYSSGALINLVKLSNLKDITVKTHNVKGSVGDVNLIPASISAGAIYIIRDPRDVVVSVSHHFSITINEAVQMLNDETRTVMSKNNLYHMLTSWKTHVTSWTKNNKDVSTLVIKYEDLLTNPVAAFNAIIGHLDLTLDDHDERFKFAMEQTTFENLRTHEIKNGFMEKQGGDKFFRVGKSGQWKNILTNFQLKMVTDYNKEIMERYKYV